MAEFSAPAKIILVGEHAVVYGQPAIAIPLRNLRAVVTLNEAPAGQRGLHVLAEDLHEIKQIMTGVQSDDPLVVTVNTLLAGLGISPPDAEITLRSQIPIASGLGSGAAIAAALGRALSASAEISLTPEALNGLVFEVEKFHHGTPSGIDNTVVVYEQPIYFVRNHPFETIDIGGTFHFLIADTGRPASTKIAVGDVRKLYEANSDQIQPVLAAIGDVARKSREAIQQGDVEALGARLNENHALLQQLTVSSPELDQLVDMARGAGALGAKLSGGGRGGNMIALVTPESGEVVEQALRRSGATRVLQTTLAP